MPEWRHDGDLDGGPLVVPDPFTVRAPEPQSIAPTWEVIKDIERTCFPSNQKVNRLFEVASHPSQSFALCKKTKKLKHTFNDMLDFEETFMITFIKNVGSHPKGGPYLTHQIIMNPQYGLEESVDRFISYFSEIDFHITNPGVDMV